MIHAESCLHAASACALATVLIPATAVAGEVTDRAYVLDRDTPSLTALAMPAGNPVGSVTLQGRPEAVLRTPHGSKILVLDQGPGKDKGEAGYQATGKSSVTIVDAAALKVLSRMELGFGILGGKTPTGLLSPDGTRLVLLCPGYESKNPAENLVRELVLVEVEKGELGGRLAIERAVTHLQSDPEVKTAFLFSARRGKKEAAQPAELRIVDLQGPRLLARIELKGDPQPPVMSPDGGFLYLLEEGSPSDKPEKNVPGSVQVVSVTSRALVATIDGGTRPREMTVDAKGKRVFFINDGAPAKGLQAAFGELRVLKGAELATKLETAPGGRFLRFSPPGDKLYVVAPAAVTVVELPGLEAHPMHLDRAKGAILYDDPGPAKELALSPDGKRAFVLYEKSSKLLVLDLDKEDTVAMVTTGRGGIKFMKALGAAALTAASYYSAQQDAARSGGGVFFYDVYRIGMAVTSIVVRPDSRYVYVLNTQSGDVTVADSASGQVVDKLAGGGNGLRMFPGGKRVAVLASGTLKLIDAEANRKGPEVPMDELRSLVPSPDEKTVLALTDSQVIAMDAATGEIRGRAAGFKKAMQVVFAPGPKN
jgi:DNA-binding beta-propeller fold protein YncE